MTPITNSQSLPISQETLSLGRKVDSLSSAGLQESKERQQNTLGFKQVILIVALIVLLLYFVGCAPKPGTKEVNTNCTVLKQTMDDYVVQQNNWPHTIPQEEQKQVRTEYKKQKCDQ